MVAKVVATVTKVDGKVSVSRREVVRIMMSQYGMTEDDATAAVVAAVEAGEVATWRGRGGSLRNAGDAPAVAAYGSKSGKPRPETKAQKREKAIRESLCGGAVENTEGAL